mgnify:CR=1 FL=1
MLKRNRNGGVGNGTSFFLMAETAHADHRKVKKSQKGAKMAFEKSQKGVILQREKSQKGVKLTYKKSQKGAKMI